MLNINSLYATLLLIRYTLIPDKVGAYSGDSSSSIPAASFAVVLARLDACVSQNGGIELLFEKALAPAAPFLLYHLKRHGFSDCKAVVTREGIVLTARR